MAGTGPGWGLPLTVAPGLVSRRAEFEGVVAAAEERLRSFCRLHGWEGHLDEPLAEAAEVVATHAEFAARLRGLLGLDPAFAVPSTYVAALEAGLLLAVSPEEFRRLVPLFDEPAAWEKLLCHELAHRLHVRLLGGDEEAMGPVWFFEGFAIVAAGQFEGAPRVLGEDGLRRVLEDPERGDYRRYGEVLRRLLERATLPDLVAGAGAAAFGARAAALLGVG